MTAVFFELLKFCKSPEKSFEDLGFWRSPETFFEGLFFSENTCACVLSPWPRALLSLASLGSVLEKAVLGFGLGLTLFLCSWPQALCPRLHLC